MERIQGKRSAISRQTRARGSVMFDISFRLQKKKMKFLTNAVLLWMEEWDPGVFYFNVFL